MCNANYNEIVLSLGSLERARAQKGSFTTYFAKHSRVEPEMFASTSVRNDVKTDKI